MERLTESYLESLGFTVSWSKDHGYYTQYTKTDEDVTKAIILVSQTSVVDSIQLDESPEVFEVWFWGKTTQGDYKELNSHMKVSSIEELQRFLSLFDSFEELKED